MNLKSIAFLLLWFAGPIFCDTECPVPTNPGADRRVNKDFLRIVQYNVEWLFIDYCASADCPGEGCPWKNVSEAETHLNSVASIVRDLDPDFINFCEVEGCDELRSLNSQVSEKLIPYLKKGTDTSTGQNVGFLSKVDPLVPLFRTEERFIYPINGSLCGYTGEPGDTGVSKHYITEFLINDYPIAIIGAHFLAEPTDPTRCAKREGQASVLQKVIYDYVISGYEVILLGDLNDFDGEIDDKNNNHPTSKVLDILKGNYGVYQGEFQLYNVAEQIEQPERYSDWWDKNHNCKATENEFSLIDHILVTPGLNKKVLKAFIYHSYTEFCGTYNSDHYPFVLDLAI